MRIRCNSCFGHGITYRIATGPDAGRKVLCVQTIPARQEDYGADQLGRIGGFSLHAGLAVNTRERKKLERTCRCISHPVLSEARLELTDQGMVRYALETAYQDGTTGRQSDMLYSSGAAFRRWISWLNWQR